VNNVPYTTKLLSSIGGGGGGGGEKSHMEGIEMFIETLHLNP